MFRRNFLRGACGAAVGLPFLESLVPRSAQAATPDPRRFIAFFECNGVNMDTFFPRTDYGALTADSFTGTALEPLTEFSSRILIPRGIHMVPRGYGRDPGAGDDHNKGMGAKLTAQPLLDGTVYAAGISVDQEIANHLNPAGVPALSLRVGSGSSNVSGVCSYFGHNQPAVPENNPWLAYQNLVGLTDLDDVGLHRLGTRRESVLDLVNRDFTRLQNGRLSQSDRDKLDMHLTAIRELEGAMGVAGLIPCVLPAARATEIEAIDPRTITSNEQFRTMGLMQMDILALAIACGNTRAATLLWGSGANGPTFQWDGMSHEYNHHKLSHGTTTDNSTGSEVAGYEQMLTDIDRWYGTQLQYLLQRLDSYTEGSGTVLDNSVVVWMNELSDGREHNFMDLPYVMIGSCGGYFKTGEYIKLTSQQNLKNDVDAPHNKLLTTILNAVGVTNDDGGPIEDFGDPAFGAPGEFDALKA